MPKALFDWGLFLASFRRQGVVSRPILLKGIPEGIEDLELLEDPGRHVGATRQEIL